MQEVSRGFEPRSLDSGSRVLTVTPRGQLLCKASDNRQPHTPRQEAGDDSRWRFGHDAFGVSGEATILFPTPEIMLRHCVSVRSVAPLQPRFGPGARSTRSKAVEK